MVSKKRKQKPNPLRTVADLRRWLRDNVAQDCVDPLHPQPWTTKRLNNAILWWWAVEEATNGGWSDLRAKDIADILLTGLKPLTLQDVQDALSEIHEIGDDSDESELTPTQETEANLRAHFGQTRNGATDDGDDE